MLRKEQMKGDHMSIVDIYEEITEAISRKLVIIINGECYTLHNPEEIFWIFEETAYMRDYLPDAFGRIIGVRYDKIAV